MTEAIAPEVTPAAAPIAPPQAAPAPAPEAKPVGPETVQTTLSWAELQKMQADLAELRQIKADAERRAKEAEERAIAAAVKEGDAQKLMDRLTAKEKADSERIQRDYEARVSEIERRAQSERERIAAEKAAAENARNALSQRAQRYALDGELSRALAGQNLVPGGADQLSQLWRSQFVVADEGESFAVRAGSGQTVGEFVAAQLARPEYAHFVRAGSPKGGTQTPGGNPGAAAPSSPAPATEVPQPRNMGEAVVLQMQGLTKRTGAGVSDMSMPMGLRAIR